MDAKALALDPTAPASATIEIVPVEALANVTDAESPTAYCERALSRVAEASAKPEALASAIAETVSTLLQVAWFKYTRRRYGEGRRLFKMSPLHNHYVVQGWSETQLVQRFWLVGIVAGMVGVGLAVLGNPC